VSDEEYKPLLANDYDSETLDPSYGDQYNTNFLKELETRKYEFAGKKTTKSKSTNDLPVGKSSPIGSKKR
jgi:hypothetical protein